MYCFDKDANLQTWGNENNENYQRVEIQVTPCNYVHYYFGNETEDDIHPECVENLEDQKTYLGALNLIVYTSHDDFYSNKFGDESIESVSKLLNMQIDEHKPNWTQSYINKNIVSDDTDLIDYGDTTERTFYQYS